MPERRVLTVAQVNRLVAGMLAEYFSDVWIEGEVSNLRAYPSGHLYFTLKDESSQIAAVCFRSSAERLKFKLTDGLLVIGHGRLDVYAPSGKYQVILEAIEPKGQGALQLAFEQLKKKLAKEGLFDEVHKRPIPELPQVVGIVTSPAGAAIHDMLRTLRLHGAKVKVLVYPAQVQGEGAAQQIAQGVEYLSARADVEVIIVGRGGGSLEDLWPFNEEVVARAIYAARVPVISGVGHEVDFTISDLVADARAATPTAAAQLVARGWAELSQRLQESFQGLTESVEQLLLDRQQRLEELTHHRAFESVRTSLAEAKHRIDLLATRIEQRMLTFRYRLALRYRSLIDRASGLVQTQFARRATRWETAGAKLHALSPLASLQRGYSICQKQDGAVVNRVEQVAAGDRISARVSDGTIDCTVIDRQEQ
jgi:exodeoxyribonuclease VII large subunit